jgi:hypothetical protein
VAPIGKVAKYIMERQNSHLTNVVQTDSEISCVLTSTLDPDLYNQELTIRVWVNPADVETLWVNGEAKSFTDGDCHILFNVKPDGLKLPGTYDITVVLR